MFVQILLLVIAIIGLIVSLFITVSNIISMRLGAPAISSPNVDHWKKFASKEKTLLDLGCGLGSMCVRAAPYFKEVYGIEYSPWYYFLATLRTRNLPNVTIIRGNFFETPWPKVDYIYCYLFPELITKLSPLLKRSKATVLSLSFQNKDDKPDEIIEQGNKKMYVYAPESRS
jgi:hypothetical protein